MPFTGLVATSPWHSIQGFLLATGLTLRRTLPTFGSLMKAAPMIIRAAQIARLKRKQLEAITAGNATKADRYQALLDCWQYNDCAKARKYQTAAQNKAAGKGTTAPPKAPPANVNPGSSQATAPNCADGQSWCAVYTMTSSA